MLIECFIKRDGPCIRTIHGIEYRFEPDEDGRLVCQVDRGEHASMMLAFPRDYREYKPCPKKKEVSPEIEGQEETKGRVVEEGVSDEASVADQANPPPAKAVKAKKPRTRRKRTI